MKMEKSVQMENYKALSKFQFQYQITRNKI